MAKQPAPLRLAKKLLKKIGRKPRPPAIGDYLDAPPQQVQVDCSPDELRRMLDRIAAAWGQFGETEPYWSVLVNDRFRTGNIEKNIDEFYASGREPVNAMLQMARRAGADLSRMERAMDFGCGVGRLTFALADRVRDVVGIDISGGHLRLARERAAQRGITNVTFEKLSSVGGLDHWQGSFDLIISSIVLQHNPPPVMAVLVEKLLDALSPHGVAIIQLPTYIQGQHFVVADYLARPQPQMEMNALPQRSVFEIIHRCGAKVLEVREDRAMGTLAGVSQTFVIQKG
ncbi:class I SAM-dependent methyltransferase [Komagataeibacter sp. FNDCF1]|uniref:class I SAM-dependent methyltransferase n=1 Tax=Komagataeibacter sp. FNDCF1 TaxID=2878681 RepID=UPI001E3CC612|nr:class I SAM-dependent methyltransferase [Komagataeibacter sp. FNDCF1]MCE2564001.1 class I SAM-dependent methyltransferase [Komagataeibacter sp. FNDCF1]